MMKNGRKGPLASNTREACEWADGPQSADGHLRRNDCRLARSIGADSGEGRRNKAGRIALSRPVLVIIAELARQHGSHNSAGFCEAWSRRLVLTLSSRVFTTAGQAQNRRMRCHGRGLVLSKARAVWAKASQVYVSIGTWTTAAREHRRLSRVAPGALQ
jgi:hypothetical protein